VATYTGSVTASTATGGTFNANNYSITYLPGDIIVDALPPPAIASSSSPSAVNTTYGTASTSSSFSISGNNMTSGILVTPPAGFEVSSDNVTFSSTVTIGTTGNIASTLVYVRLASTTPAGNYSGNIAVTSTGATELDVAMPVSTVSPVALTITVIGVSKAYGAVITGSAGSTAFMSTALQNGENIGSITIGYGAGSAATDGVGTYTGSAVASTATGGTFNPSNYAITYVAGDIIVTAIPLTITANAVHKQFGTVINGAAGSLAFTPTGLVNGESIGSVTIAYGTGSAAADPVATYTGSVTASTATGGTFNANNYIITYLPGDIIVDALPPPAIASSSSPSTVNTTYGTASASSSFSISGSNMTSGILVTPPPGFEVSSDNVTFSSTVTIGAAGAITSTPVYIRLSSTTPAGNYSGNIALTGAGATEVDIAMPISVVSPATLTITASAVGKAYGASITGSAGSTAFTSSALQNGENIGSVTIVYGTGSAATDGVGTYTGSVMASLATGGTFNPANYSISYVAGDITVGAIPLTITANSIHKQFGTVITGAAGSLAFTPTGLVNGESIGGVTIAYGTGSAATDPVATYTGSVTASAATGGTFNANNYIITYLPGDIIVDALPPPAIASSSSPSAVNTTYGTASASSSFSISGSNMTSGILVTPPAGFEVSIDNVTFSSTVTIGAAGNITSTPVYIRLATATPAGNYSGNIALTGTGATELDVAMPVSVVSPATLTITATGVSKAYGASITGSAGSTAFTSSALQNGETIGSITIDYGTGSVATDGVGTYTGSVVASTATGGTFNPANYSINYVAGDITVGAIPLTITANSIHKQFGTVITGAAGSLAFTATGLVNGESVGSVTITYGTGSAAADPVATYTGSVTASAATGGTFNPIDYIITYLPGDIIVDTLPPPAITDSSDPSSVNTVYGTASSSSSFSISGSNMTSGILVTPPAGFEVSSDNVSFSSTITIGAAGNIASTPVYIRLASTTPAGNYSGNIALTGTGATELDVAMPVSTVSPAVLTITATGVSKAYGTAITGSAGSTAFTSTALQNGENIGSVTIAYGTGSAATDGVGTYAGSVLANTASGGTFNPNNYSITYAASDITVTPANLTITANNVNKPFGTAITGGPGSTAFTPVGLQNGETIGSVTIAYGTGSAAADPVATYTGSVTASGAIAGTFTASNYIIIYLPGDIVVTAPLAPAISTTSSPSALNTTYGTASTSSSFSISGTNMTAGILVTPPAGFEVSADDITFGLTVTVGAAGTVTATPVYIRLASTTPVGAYSGNIATTSAGANEVDVAMPNSTVTPAVLTITAGGVSKTFGATLTGGPGSTAFTASGLQNGETIGSVTIVYGTGSAATDGVGTYTGSVVASAATGGTFNAANYIINYVAGDIIVNASPTPTLTASGSPSALNTIYGTASTSTTFNVSGANLSAGILVTPPVGFEVSLDNVTFSSSVTVGAAGTIVSTPVYIRLASTTPAGNYSGNIILSSVGATDINVAMTTSSVSPAPLIITANNINKTYGASLGSGPGSTAFTSTALQNSETIGNITITYGTGSAATDPVATYIGSVTASLATGGTFNPGNYTITYVPGDIIVNPAVLTISAIPVNKVFGATLTGTAGSTNFTSTGLQNVETIGSVTVAYGTGAAASDGVGTYTGSVVISLATGGTFISSNYIITYTPSDIIVGPAPPPVIASSSSPSAVNTTYGTASASSSFSISGDNMTSGILVTPPAGFEVSSDNVTFSGTVTIGATGTITSTPVYIRLASATAVGNYSGNIALTGSGATDVDIAIPVSVVSPAALTITATTVNKTFGATLTGGPGSTAFTSTGLQNGETIGSITITYGTGSASSDPVATYAGSVVASVAAGGTFNAANYTITYLPGDIIVNTATAAAITSIGSLSAVNTTYGTASASSTFNISGTNMSAGILVTPPVGFEVSSDNVTFSSSVTIGAAGTIASTPVYIRLASITPVGSYSGNIVLSSVGATDVNVAMPVSVVSPTALTITASTVNKTFGSTLTGGPGSTAFISTGLQNGETVGSVTIAYGTGAAATDPVATYTVSVIASAATGGTFNPANYTITYLAGDIIVGPAPLTITATTVNKTFGATLTGGPGSTAFTSTGLQNGETIGSVTIAYGTGSAASDPVATYIGSVIASAATGGSFNPANYTITYLPGDIIVNEATSAAITAIGSPSAVNTTYGTASSSSTFNISGTNMSAGILVTPPIGFEVSSDNITFSSSVTVGAAGTIASTPVYIRLASTTPVGSYSGNIVLSSVGATDVNVAMPVSVVSPAALTITATTVNKTFGATLTGGPGSTAFTSTGLQNGETIGSVTIAYGAGSAGTDPVATYTGSVVASAATGGSFNPANYTITYLPGDIIVNAATAAAITSIGNPSAVNTTYGTASASSTFNISGSNLSAGILVTPPAGFEVSSDNVTFGSFVTIGAAGTIASTPVYIRLASITPVSSYSGNIVLSSVGATDVNVAMLVSVVNPAALTITASIANKTFGATLTGAPGSTAFTSTGLQNGETIGSVTIAYGTGSAGTDPVATYTGSVVASAATGGSFNPANYTITYLPDDIIVAPAALTITASTVNKTFGATLTGGPGSTAFTSTGLQNGETIGSITIAYSTGSAATDPVAIYTGSVVASAATGGSFNPANYTITYSPGDIIVNAATAAAITSIGSPSSVNTTYGTASASSTFNISGANMSAGILVTSPVGFEVSSDNITFSSSVTIGAAGTIASTPVYVRLASLTPVGSYSGNIVLSSVGATDVNVAMPVSLVSPAALTIIATTVNKTFGATLTGGPGSTAFTSTGLQNGETIGSITITYGTGSASSDPAATYAGSVVASVATGGTFNAANYTITYLPGDIIVNAATSAAITSVGSPSAVNTTYGTASASSTFNISGTNLSAGILVTPPVGFEVSSDNVTFSSSVTIGAAGTIASTPVYIRLASTTPAGSYSGNIVLSSVGATDVNVAMPVSVVSPTALTITASTVNKTFGSTLTGGPGSTAFISTGLQNGETVGSVTIAYGTGAAATDPVATYTGSVVASAATGGSFNPANYTITYLPGDIIVAPAPLTITASTVNKTFGAVLTGGPGSTAFTSIGLQNGETIGSVTIAYGTGSAASDPVATYTGSVTASTATGGSFNPANYTINYLPGDIIVNAATSAAITSIGNPSAVNTTYGTASASSTFNISGTNMSAGILVTPPVGFEVSSDNVTFSSSVTIGAAGTIASTPVYIRLASTTLVGSYSGNIVLSSVGATDVNVAMPVSVVSPAALTITATTVNKTFGATLTGGPGSTAFTSTGLQNGETIGSVTITYGAGSASSDPVATYIGSVVASAATGGSFNPANYTITYLPGDIIVNTATAAAITSIGSSSAVNTTYGTASASSTFNISGTNMSAGILVTPPIGFEVSSDNITFSSSVTVGAAGTIASTPVYIRLASTTPVGSYSGNIVLSSVGATDVNVAMPVSLVSPVALTITATTVNKTFGATLTGGPGSTAFTSTGLQNGETIGSVTIAYGTGSAASDPVATYTGSVIATAATGGTFNAANYTINYLPGDIIVNAATAATITSLGNPSAVNTTYGTASASSTFNISGANTSAGILVTPPAGFEVSSDNVTFSSSVTIGAAGTIVSTPVYIRLASTTTVSSYSGNVVLSSVGATDVNVAMPVSVVSPAALTITAITVNKTFGSTLTGGPGSTASSSTGLQNGESIGSVTISYGSGSAASDPVATYAGSVVASAATGGSFNPANYTITYSPGDIIVAPATLTITATTVNKTFGATLTGGPSSTAFTSTGLQNGETIGSVTISYGTGSAGTDPVATYTGSVVASAATGGSFNSANYTITYLPGDIIVNAATSAAITSIGGPSAVNSTYGTASVSATFNVSGSNMSAGILVIPPTGFEVSSDNITFSSSVTLGAAGTIASTPVYIRLAATTPVGSYSGNIVLNSVSATDVNVAMPVSVVSPAALTITAPTVNKTFGATLTGGSGSTAFTSTGLQNGETIGSVTIAYGTGSAASDPVAGYMGSVVASAATGGSFNTANYKIIYSPGDIFVAPAVLTITASTVNKTFGARLTGGPGSTAFTSTGLQNGETVGSVTIAYGTGSAPVDPVATYTSSVVPSAATGGTFNAGNYTITYLPGDIIVNAAAEAAITATGSPSPENTTYGAASASSSFNVSGTSMSAGILVTPPVGFEVSADNVIFNNSVTIGASGTINSSPVYIRLAATTPVGGYSGKIALTSNGATEVDVNMPASQVSAAMLSITANSVHKIFGTTLTGGPGSTAFISTGLQNGETIGSVTIAYGAGSAAADPAATYTGSITASSAIGGSFSESNYIITYLPGDIIVDPPPTPVIASASSPSAVNTTYGTPSPSSSFNISGNNMTSGILVTPPAGFEVSADDVTFSSTVTIGSAGTIASAPVYIRLAATTIKGSYSGNIALSSAGATAIDVVMPVSTVNPSILVITADNQTKVEGQVNPVLTVSFSGFVNNETSAALTALPVAVTTAVTSSLPGQYPITVDGAASTNYIFDYVGGVLTVTAPESIVVPNAFTPNGDGINDTWNIKNIETYPNCTVQVFNRYGQEVYSSRGYGISWNGTFKGSALPTGAYYYIIDLKNGSKVLSGSIAIIR